MAKASTDALEETEHPGGNNWKVLLCILTPAVMMMSSSYTMLIPFLPIYLTEELGVTENVNFWSGAVFSITFLISTVMAPIWGSIADRGSRKLMALRSAVLLTVSYALGGVVQTPMQLVLVRALQGVAAGLWPALLSIMSANCPPQKTGISMGVLQGALTAGGVIGPMLGGVLAQHLGMRVSFYCGGAALFVITLLILFAVKEPKKKALPKEKKTEVSKSEKKKMSFFRNPVILGLLITAAVTQMSVTISMPIFSFYVAELQGSKENIIALSGYVFAVLGIAGVIASPLWGWIGQTIGHKRVLLISMFFAGVFAVLSALPPTLTPFVVIRFIGGLAFAGIFPALNALFTEYTPSTERGRIFGMSFSVQQCGSIIGPLAGGAVASGFSLQWTMIFGGLVQFIPLVWIFFQRKKFLEKNTGTLGIPKTSVH